VGNGIGSVYVQGEQKLHGQTFRRWIYTLIQGKIYCMTIGLLKCGFSSYDLIIEENALSVPLSFHANIGGDTSGTLISSTKRDWSCLPWFLMKLPRRIVARCGSADCDSFMVHAWGCSTTFLYSRGEILANVYLEQLVGQGRPTARPAHFLI